MREPVQPQQLLILLYLSHKDNYDVDRTYQRAPGAWTTRQEQFFIDSILRGYSVPMVFIHKKKKKKWIIDGQHRLLTIEKFANNELELHKKYSEDIINESGGNRIYEELDEKYQEQFDIYPLPVVYLEDYADEEIRSLFRRLQSGTNLSVGEKLNAYPGNIVPLMRKLGNRKFFQEIIPFSMERYKNYKLAANFLYLENIGIDNIGTSNIYDFFERYKDLDESSKEYKNALQVLNFLERSLDKNMAELRNQAWVNTLYLFISYLIDKKYSLDKTIIRKFLIDFYNQVQKAEQEIDRELIKFDIESSRGTTSKKSLQIRHDIILDRFFSRYEITAKDDNRFFNDEQKIEIYRKYDGKCQICSKSLTFKNFDTHYHHKKAWSKGGKSSIENGLLVCKNCHLKKIHSK